MRYAPGTKVDHFEIVREIGEGAYAESYQARDLHTGEMVVLKSPNPALLADPAIFARFRREAKIARLLDHPNIVRGLDDGEHRTDPYLVLEYIDGQNFRRHLKAYDHRVPVNIALRWGRQLADALGYIHQHGIVHRDLKPENIMVTADGDLKVIDFGTALLDGAKRLTWRNLSESLGTPDYMSPEQVQGNRGDTRSDVYAWGVMMYEFLTGHVPFAGDNWMAVMAGHLTRVPERIRTQNPFVSPELEAVVLKAMRRYPENRYQTPEEISRDLERIDEINTDDFDLSPEPPMGGMAAMDSGKRLFWVFAIVALVFVAIVAVILLVAALR
jgi:eukaryotic-like serine/threonine-protein kinase